MIQTTLVLDLALENVECNLTGHDQVLQLTPSIKQVKQNEEIQAIPNPPVYWDANANTKRVTIPCLKPVRTQSKFTALQKWEGFVLEVSEENFTARLVDLKNKGIEEEAEIYITEVTEEDRPLLKPGAIFYWSIGYLDHYSGQRFNTGMIRFRRLPGFSRQEIDLARKKAQEIRRLFGWDHS
ncbi:MAG: hypothetical protein RKP20_04630 [Candidatus Competibacter sp.]|nr:hypothetical protein [Candidatus Competibacter sp.]